VPENGIGRSNAASRTAERQNSATRGTLGATPGWIAAWAWTILAGSGGLWLLWTKGPLPSQTVGSRYHRVSRLVR
jgi:hypothetical protein